ncbi:MAG TPA: CBS domain-containing protein [Anaerolineae bacterium]|nr:CBS domain-containing protein [Anaerolineae bacterium]HOR00324.1 CBS domain-containing protein [Anaerolineae bacterium]
MTAQSEGKPVEKRVKDIMHRGVITCKPDTLLKEVVRMLADTGVHALIVAESGTEIEGVISHTDVIRLYGKNLLDYKARDIMTPLIYEVPASASIPEAIEVLARHRVHRLVVTEQGARGKIATGVLSTTDIIREMRGQMWYW